MSYVALQQQQQQQQGVPVHHIYDGDELYQPNALD